MSFEQMKAITEKALEDTKETVAYFNDAPANVKDNLRNKLRNSLNKLYMSYDNREDRFIVNDTLPKLELYNFQLNQEIYKNGTSISKAYEENGIEASHQYVKVENTLSTATKKLSFKDAFLKYADMITKNQFTPQLTALEREQPLIREGKEFALHQKICRKRFNKSGDRPDYRTKDSTNNHKCHTYTRYDYRC